MNRDFELEFVYDDKWIIYKGFDYGIGRMCMKTSPCLHDVINLNTKEIKRLSFREILKQFKQDIDDFDIQIHGNRVNPNLKEKPSRTQLLSSKSKHRKKLNKK